MDTTSQSLFDICKNIQSYPHCFYGSFSRISFELTMEHTLRVGIAPILDEMKGKTGGKIAPGTKLYNDDAKAVFTLNHDDVAKIMRYWKEIRTNTYTNPDPKCKPEYKNKFNLVHFGNNNSFSTFSLVAKDNDTTKLNVSIKSQDGHSASFQLTNDDVRGIYSLTHFENLIQNVAKNGIYDKLNFQAIIKRINSSLYKVVNGGNNNGNNGGNSNYNNNRSNNYQNNNRNNYNNNNNTQQNRPAQQIQPPRQQEQYNEPQYAQEFDLSSDFNDLLNQPLDSDDPLSLGIL